MFKHLFYLSFHLLTVTVHYLKTSMVLISRVTVDDLNYLHQIEGQNKSSLCTRNIPINLCNLIVALTTVPFLRFCPIEKVTRPGIIAASILLTYHKADIYFDCLSNCQTMTAMSCRALHVFLFALFFSIGECWWSRVRIYMIGYKQQTFILSLFV